MASDNTRSAGFSLNGSPSPATYYHQQYKMNGKIIIGSLAVLCTIVLTILGLHLYAKWFWRRANRRQALLRRRNALDLQDQEPLRTGLDKAVVESLPTFIYKVSPGQKDALECAVCLSEFQEDEKGRLLPKCNHCFHTSCIDMWFLSNTTCPLCRLSAEPTVSASSEESQDAASLPLLVPQDRLDSRDVGSHSDSGEERPDVSGEPSRNGVGSLLRRQFSFQSPRGRSWRRSISDHFPQISQGVQFPTNVLFWGNHSHVSSRVNAEHWQIGGRSLPHIVIEVPRGQDSSLAPQVTSVSPSHCCSFEDQSCSSPSMQRPFNRFNSLKRLLSREKKMASSDQASNSGGAQGGSGL